MYEEFFHKKVAAAVRVSRIDFVQPDFNTGNLYANVKDNRLCIFTCPVEDDYQTVLEDCVEALKELASDPEKKDTLWNGTEWYREYQQKK